MAPNSLASIFGSGLATAIAIAELDSDGQLPTRLAGTGVQVNGRDAALLYVSPQQINFLVPDQTAAGVAEIVVLRGSGSGALNATVQVSNASAGLFDGAVVNAVTQAFSPFRVETPENAGDDKRTRLAVYGTGIRRAASVTAEARDGNSRLFNLVVEYAGAAPGFFGLDQVNLVVPPEMDGAGAVSLTVTATVPSPIPLRSSCFRCRPAPSVRPASASIPMPSSRATRQPAPSPSTFPRLPPDSRSRFNPVRSPALVVPLTVTIPSGKCPPTSRSAPPASPPCSPYLDCPRRHDLPDGHDRGLQR